ncbi:MAG: hypothetical protein WA719_03145 [Thermoplasmata archaeon]
MWLLNEHTPESFIATESARKLGYRPDQRPNLFSGVAGPEVLFKKNPLLRS